MARVEGQKPMIAFASVGSWTKADALGSKAFSGALVQREEDPRFKRLRWHPAIRELLNP